MNANDVVPGLTRSPDIPVYGGIYRLENIADSSGYQPGRVILTLYDGQTGRVDDRLIDIVEPNDVVFVPLYAGRKLRDRWLADTTQDKSEYYDENIDIIREIGPKVRGILVGNAGPELTFKHVWRNAGEQAPRKMMSEIASDFVKETAEFICDAGAQPFYGTIDWDLAADCYYGNGLLRDTVNDVGGVQICFTGYQLFGVYMHGPGPMVPHPDDHMFWPVCPKAEMMPKPDLQKYLRGGEFWTGVNGPDGLDAGNDIELAKYGFDVGVMGWPKT